MSWRLLVGVVVVVVVSTPSVAQTRSVVDKLMKQLPFSATKLDAASARQQLASLRTQAGSPAERAVIDKMIGLVDAVDDDRIELETIFARYHDVLHDVGALAPDDPETQVALAERLQQLSMMAERRADGPFVKEVRQRWDELVARFPDNAHAHASRALAGVRTGLPLLTAARELGRCIELDHGKLKQSCTTWLAQTADAYEQPFCGKANVDPRFRVLPEVTAGRAVTLGAETFHVGDEPVLRATDVVEVRRETVHVEEPDASGHYSARDVQACWIELAPASLPAVATTSTRWREQGVPTSNGWRPGKAFFLLGDRALLETDAGTWGFFTGVQVKNDPKLGDCFQVCAHTEHRTLPAELRALLPPVARP